MKSDGANPSQQLGSGRKSLAETTLISPQIDMHFMKVRSRVARPSSARELTDMPLTLQSRLLNPHVHLESTGLLLASLDHEGINYQ